MIKPIKMAALALPLIASVAFPASAGVITNVEVPYSQRVTLQNGILGSSSMAVGITGQIVLTTDSGILGTWCVDLFHRISLGGQYTYTTSPQVSNNADGSKYQLLSDDQISGIAQLAAFGNAVLDAATDRPYTISSSLAAAYMAGLDAFKAAYGEATYTELKNNISVFSAAIQASIWNLEYGTTATSGNVLFASFMETIRTGKGYFSGIGGYQLNPSNGAQKEFVSEIPEPASLVLVGVGLLILGPGVNRRKRRAA